MNTALTSAYVGAIKVKPRWPYRRVVISKVALQLLERCQGKLEPDVRLVLTRGFEPGNAVFRTLHKACRWLGSIFFRFVFPERKSECGEIFGSNGHDVDGTHIDVAVECRGSIKKLLPRGVFSTSYQLERIRENESALLEVVYKALRTSGFRIHSNPTEALQIHCDMIGSETDTDVSPGQP